MAGKMLEMKNMIFADFIAESCSFSEDENSCPSGMILTEDMIKKEPGFIVEDNTESRKIRDYLLKAEINGGDVEKLIWHNCVICEQRFSNIEDLGLHVQEHIKKEKSDANIPIPKVVNHRQMPKAQCTSFTREELFRDYVKIRVSLEGDPTYTCKLCSNEDFTKLLAIRNHMRLHESPVNTDLNCHICNRSFLRHNALLMHMQTHQCDRPFVCDICNNRFAHSSSLISHKRIHSGEKPFECDICHNKYRESGQMTTHRKTHFGKTLQCPECKQMYASLKNLRVHLRTHTGERPYNCNMCEKTFRTSTSLTLHIRVHTGEKPFKCMYCPYATKQSGCLKTHMRTHTGEKPHKCGLCERAYSERKRLVTHYRTHTGERPYKCTYCESAFTRSDHCRSHIRTHERKLQNLSRATQ